MKRYNIILLAVMTISSFLLIGWLSVGASEESEPITEGLVSRYCGESYGIRKWTDLAGNNDITDPVGTFENGYYILDGCGQPLPSGIENLLKGDRYTVEFSLGNIYSKGGSFLALIYPDSPIYSYDLFSLYIDQSTDTLYACVFECDESKGLSIKNATSRLCNATVTVTYSKEGALSLYLNGVLYASVSAPQKTATGYGSLSLSCQNAIYKSYIEYKDVRFYDRVLSETEIVKNARFDGHYQELLDDPSVSENSSQEESVSTESHYSKDSGSYPEPSEEKTATVYWDGTNVLGGLTVAERLNTQQQLENVLKNNSECAVLICKIDEELYFVDEDGKRMQFNLRSFFDMYKYDFLPAFYPSNERALTELKAFCNGIGFQDYMIVSNQTEILKKVTGNKRVLELKDGTAEAEYGVSDIVILPSTTDISLFREWLCTGTIPWIYLEEESNGFEIFLQKSRDIYGVVSENASQLYEKFSELPPKMMLRQPEIIYRPKEDLKISEVFFSDAVNKGVTGFLLDAILLENGQVCVGIGSERMDYAEALRISSEKNARLYILLSDPAALYGLAKYQNSNVVFLSDNAEELKISFPNIRIAEFGYAFSSEKRIYGSEEIIFTYSATEREIRNALMRGQRTVCLDTSKSLASVLSYGYAGAVICDLNALSNLVCFLKPDRLENVSDKELKVSAKTETFDHTVQYTDSISVHILEGSELVERIYENRIYLKEDSTGRISFLLRYLQTENDEYRYIVLSDLQSVYLSNEGAASEDPSSTEPSENVSEKEPNEGTNAKWIIISIGGCVFLLCIVGIAFLLKRREE